MTGIIEADKGKEKMIRRYNKSYLRYEWGNWYIGKYGRPLWKHNRFEN